MNMHHTAFFIVKQEDLTSRNTSYKENKRREQNKRGKITLVLFQVIIQPRCSEASAGHEKECECGEERKKGQKREKKRRCPKRS